MTKQTILPNTFANLSSSLGAITVAAEKAAKAREFFSSVDFLVLRPKGSVSSKTTEELGTFEYRTKVVAEGGEAKWTTAKSKCVERTLKAWRYCETIDPETHQVSGNIVLAITIKTYLDQKSGDVIGVSSKNSRFDKALILGKADFRAWGHKNTFETTDRKTGEKVAKEFFNLVTASSLEAKTEDVFGELPEMES